MSGAGFANFIRILPEPCLLVTTDGAILAANPAFRILLGAAEPEDETLFSLAVTPPEKLRQYLRNCARSRQMVLGAISLSAGAGAPVELRCEGALFEPGGGGEQAAVIFLRFKPKDAAGSKFRVLTEKIEALNKEIAERRRAEMESERLYREACEASRLKDEFLATVSHEMRTPLSVILGWTQLLRSNHTSRANFDKALEIIERNARVQTRLTEDLLDVSRIITGNLKLNAQPLDLTKIVAGAVEALQPTAANKSVEIEVSAELREKTVSGDAPRLQQVLWNILSNAIKFTPKKGRILVHSTNFDGHAVITVSDTGEGISPEFLPFVFDRFRQSDSSKSRRHGGLGLGLAIVRHLVELHGGTVEAQSDGVGRGAKFTVRLPVTAAPAFAGDPGSNDSATSLDARPHAFEFSARLDGLHVLIVDDEPDALELLRTILEKCEATVTAAASASEVLGLLGVIEPDAFVSDIEMPHEDGFSLIRKIRRSPDEKWRRLPTVALTAHARLDDRQQAYAAGFDAHLAKPFEPGELVALLERLTAKND